MTEQHARLLAELEAAGHLTDAWRPAFERVPRHLFVPDTAWFGTQQQPVSRLADEELWLARSYEDQPIVTQFDDGAVRPGDPAGQIPTSSISMPTVVAIMLREAHICDGMKVLEIGTGSGWNAALLAARLGDRAVYTVEIDPAVLAQARKALSATEWRLVTVQGDGFVGYPAGAPYDRVISTCSVYTVPQAWIDQTRPGGLVVTPWRAPLLNGLLIQLEIQGDGSAHGPFVDTAAFMAMRGQRRPGDEVPARDEHDTRTANVEPAAVLDYEGANLAAALLVPDCDSWIEHKIYGTVYAFDDLSTGSWARVVVPRTDDDPPPIVAHQHGPRHLWDEIEESYAWWVEAGSPTYKRFGLTVRPDGRHRYWLDEPDHLIKEVM